MTPISKEEAIRALVRTAVEAYANGFKTRHLAEVKDPEGTINMKIHNVFISALGPEIQYYSALARSLDSSLGNMLEDLAINIAKLFFDVKKHVEGPLSNEQTAFIAKLLEQYKSRRKKPSVKDYEFLRNKAQQKKLKHKRHDSDYYQSNRRLWDSICRSEYGYQWVSETYRDVVAKIKFSKTLAEMALWQKLTQYAL